jgi:hypothetical protein
MQRVSSVTWTGSYYVKVKMKIKKNFNGVEGNIGFNADLSKQCCPENIDLLYLLEPEWKTASFFFA